MTADRVQPNRSSRYNLRPRPTTRNSIIKCKNRLRHTDRKLDDIPYFSPLIIFNILIYLPAEILYNAVRYVCQEWFDIISSPHFIEAHLKTTTERGLLLKQFGGHCIHYIEPSLKMNNDDTRLQLVEVAYSEDKWEWEYGMSTSCNGLVFTYNAVEQNNRRLVNFITKEAVNLPLATAGSPDVKFSSIGYTRLSKKYKLVEFHMNHQAALECAILTVGVDREWRSLFQVHNGAEIENFGIFEFKQRKQIISAEGILHVVHGSLPLVFNLDLETETFYTCATPKCSTRYGIYLGNGRSLYFMDELGDFSWELWVLKDAETGEWTKEATLDLGPQETMLRHTFCPMNFFLTPVGFLKDGEIVIFYINCWQNMRWHRFPDAHSSRNCITYNIKEGGDIKSIRLDKGYTYQMNEQCRHIPYVKSLVSPKKLVSEISSES